MNKKYKEFKVSFDTAFFSSLKTRWLKSKEIYLLLQSINELLQNKDIFLITDPKELFLFENTYFFTLSSNIPLFFSSFEKKSVFSLRVNGLPRVQCNSYSKSSLTCRVYQLYPIGKYSFIHMRKSEVLTIKDTRTELIQSMIKIIDFSPDKIEANNDNEKMLIIIKSLLDEKELKHIIPNMSISFGKKFVKCVLLTNNVLQCTIPPQNEKEVIIEIFLSSKNNTVLDKISYYDNNKKCFKYIKNDSKTEYNKHIMRKCISKIDMHIFNCSSYELIHNTTALLKDLLSHITFYSNKSNSNAHNINININKLIENFTEEKLCNIITTLLNELNKINKLYLINFKDNEGYNLLHYCCALDYYNILSILIIFKVDLNIKSESGLSAYEICAGRRNLNCLMKLIEAIDNDINETGKEEKFIYDLDVLKSALNISLERKDFDLNDIKVLDLLIKQIKIKYTVDMTSEKIIEDIQKKEGEYYDSNNIKKIQSSVRGWLRRNKYQNMKKAAINLIEKLKNYQERKRYLTFKHSAIIIQTQISSWLNRKHKKAKESSSENK